MVMLDALEKAIVRTRSQSRVVFAVSDQRKCAFLHVFEKRPEGSLIIPSRCEGSYGSCCVTVTMVFDAPWTVLDRSANGVCDWTLDADQGTRGSRSTSPSSSCISEGGKHCLSPVCAGGKLGRRCARKPRSEMLGSLLRSKGRLPLSE